MTNTALKVLFALLVAGCSGEVSSKPEACAPVACAWSDVGTCSAQYASTGPTLETIDDGAAVCRVYEATCVPVGTPAECIPAECHRSIADCQPAGDARTGRP